MAEFFASGAVADLVLAVLAAEAALLIVTAPGLAALRARADILFHLLSGAGLAAALRLALAGAFWPWIGAALTLAFVAHAAALAARGLPGGHGRDAPSRKPA